MAVYSITDTTWKNKQSPFEAYSHSIECEQSFILWLNGYDIIQNNLICPSLTNGMSMAGCFSKKQYAAIAANALAMKLLNDRCLECPICAIV